MCKEALLHFSTQIKDIILSLPCVPHPIIFTVGFNNFNELGGESLLDA